MNSVFVRIMPTSFRVLFALGALSASIHADTVRVSGSATLARAMQAAVPAIKEQIGTDLQFDTDGGSTAALFAVMEKSADLAMVTREVTPQDRARFPANRIFDLEIGMQVLVPIVSRETWDAGVKSIKKDDFVALYEGDVSNWKQLGAEDRAVKFYNPEPGFGIWELFVTWLYGDVRRAPLGKKWEKITSPQAARDSVEFNQGSISIVSPKWADGKRVIALPIREPDGTEITPTVENFQSLKWPMTRPLFLVAADKPTGSLRKVMEMMVREPGREALTKVDFIPKPGADAKMREMMGQ
jgi:phosphate transport system substrate-binding protein